MQPVSSEDSSTSRLTRPAKARLSASDGLPVGLPDSDAIERRDLLDDLPRAIALLDPMSESPSRGHRAGRACDIRRIFLHMMRERAEHNGHADPLRERLDGVTGD